MAMVSQSRLRLTAAGVVCNDPTHWPPKPKAYICICSMIPVGMERTLRFCYKLHYCAHALGVIRR